MSADERAALTDVGLDLSPGTIPAGVYSTVERVNWLTVPDLPADVSEKDAMLVVRIERETVENAVGLSQEESLDSGEDAAPQAVNFLGSLLVQGRGADGTIRQAYVATGGQLAAEFAERSPETEHEEPAMLEVALRLGDLVGKEEVTEVRFVYQDLEREQPLTNSLDTEPEWASTDKYPVPIFDLTQNTPVTSA